jgi:hypothetical protein
VAKGGRCYSVRPHSLLQQASGRIFKDDVNGLPSTSDICFMIVICNIPDYVADQGSFYLYVKKLQCIVHVLSSPTINYGSNRAISVVC